jgi:hypothetical protein
MSGLPSLRDAPAPAPRDVAPNVLADLLRSGVRPWWSVADRLSTAVTTAFWGLAFLNGIFAGWLAAVQAGVAACSGPACTVATLGGHPLSALILALSCVAALTVAALSTRGLRWTDGLQLAVIVTAGVCGVVALAGVVALLIGVALCLVVVFGVLVVVADRL